jgi:membrane-associated phospholipid phosphatase
MTLPWQSPEFAHDLAGTLLFVYGALIVQEPLLHQPGPDWRRTLIFWTRAGSAMLLTAALAELGKRVQIWPGHPAFPSGHTAQATVCCVCLIRLRGKRWAWLTVPLLPAMAWALKASGAHNFSEIAGGLLLGALVGLLGSLGYKKG